jgi:hemerythrin-like domain-containing protein
MILNIEKMRNVTSILSDEHQTIMNVIESILDECEQLESGKEINTSFFNDAVLFITQFADGYHHAKEEDVLFKAMLNNLEQMHCNPIPVMLHEHEVGRQYVKGMVTALAQEDKMELIQNSRGYCALLQNHIFKEDNVLYPIAEDTLSDIQKQQIEDAYQSVQADNFNKKELHALIHKLARNH